VHTYTHIHAHTHLFMYINTGGVVALQCVAACYSMLQCAAVCWRRCVREKPRFAVAITTARGRETKKKQKERGRYREIQ